jgi:hypothetical protein
MNPRQAIHGEPCHSVLFPMDEPVKLRDRAFVAANYAKYLPALGRKNA